jgi:iron complex outermembrane receptor protein
MPESIFRPGIPFQKVVLLASTALSIGVASPAAAQDAAIGSDIIVTARRVEERLQDVPISITVLNQAQITNNNISNMKDLAAYTPGLQVNSRYGSDSTNFTVRGFTQEQRTYATVGTYFADVVAPRGSGATFGGDGAGPGALFDLANVQILKGPQGTLQGRNVTGGAVLLVPRKPTGRFEGYVEGSIGDYDMRRVQAVVNIPVMDTLRVRFGLDRQTRDGYLRNIGAVGDGYYGNKGMGNVDYWAGRASIVADLTPNLENYTIISYTQTKSNGVIPKTWQCTNGALSAQLQFGAFCAAQKSREDQYDFWTVSNRLPSSRSATQQWQIINTTTWQASDSLTIKNNLAYGQFRGTTNLDLFGNYFPVALGAGGITPIPASAVTSANQLTGFAFTSAEPFSGKTNAQQSLVEELQFQGHPGNGKFVWQVGLYAEINDPLGWSGVQTATTAACADIASLNCAFGSANFQRSKSKFRDYAAYGQASYNVTEKLKFTAGIRYTWDKQISQVQIETLNIAGATTACSNISVFGAAAAGRTFPIAQRSGVCTQSLRQDTEAPTWLLGVDYKAMEDLLVYAKYSRGYRQGGLSLFSPDTTQPFDKESVDTYEVGVKASWHGRFPGSFNVAGYYNNFKDQQLLLGVTSSTPGVTPSASIVNAGKSKMQGIEAELNMTPFKGYHFSVAYSYLDTQLQQFITPAFPAGSIYNQATPPAVGGDIPNAGPDHRLVVQASYQLPLPDSIGRISFGGAYSYSAKYRAVADACPSAAAAGCTSAALGFAISNPGGGILPATSVINLNVNWDNVAGYPVDLAFFMTNVGNERIFLSANDNSNRGFVSRLPGEPRMFGFRMKYRFGS